MAEENVSPFPTDLLTYLQGLAASSGVRTSLVNLFVFSSECLKAWFLKAICEPFPSVCVNPVWV